MFCFKLLVIVISLLALVYGHEQHLQESRPHLKNDDFLIDPPTTNENIDHVLSLLADVHYGGNNHPEKNYLASENSIYENQLFDTTNGLPEKASDDSWFITKIFRSLLKKTQELGKGLGDVILTVNKVSHLYKETRREILSNSTIREHVGIETEDDVRYDPNTSVSDAFLNVVFDPVSVEKVVEVSSTSDTEDEILGGLMEVILGADSRSGGGYSSLTLDPVTIIALLTLAAYLIRAVFQILNNNNNTAAAGTGRGIPEELISNVPEFIARAVDYAAGVDFDQYDERFERSFKDAGGIVSFPGSVVAITKLRREGHKSCIRHYVCDSLAARDIFSYSLEDILIASMGYFYAQADVWQLVDPTSNFAREERVDACGLYDKKLCKDHTLKQALKIRDMFAKASAKFLSLWTNARAAKLRSHRRGLRKQGF